MDHPQTIRPGELLKAETWQFQYRQKCNPRTSHLNVLSYGTYHIAANVTSDELCHRSEEALLFCLSGQPTVEVRDRSYAMAHYDTLYVPKGEPYRIVNEVAEEGMLVVCRACAEQDHPVHHSVWDQVRQDESRIRHLDGKDVFLMFDVSEPADRLLAGYTIFEPHTRAWPPHNHSDQEEIYLFTKGHGSIEVYPDEKSKTFVHSMAPLDAATIPLLNYHPVFSQDEEVHFIWCLAGERYWVGDKHKEFMDASVDELTT